MNLQLRAIETTNLEQRIAKVEKWLADLREEDETKRPGESKFKSQSLR